MLGFVEANVVCSCYSSLGPFCVCVCGCAVLSFIAVPQSWRLHRHMFSPSGLAHFGSIVGLPVLPYGLQAPIRRRHIVLVLKSQGWVLIEQAW